nr:MAG TPA: hypothetical protein [Caudoviricetes sp.]
MTDNASAAWATWIWGVRICQTGLCMDDGPLRSNKVIHCTQICVAKLLAPHLGGVYSFRHREEKKDSSQPH